MVIGRCICICISIVMIGLIGGSIKTLEGRPQRILLDTDVDADDLFALLYLLKLNRSDFDLQAITINSDAWINAGHAVNQVYDILYMMGRDDIAVGGEGEGGTLEDGTILPNVGGYHPIIEQPHIRYTSEDSVKYGAPRDTDHPELRQPLTMEIWRSDIQSLVLGSKVTILTNGPLTSIANNLISDKNHSSPIQDIFIVGGHSVNVLEDVDPMACYDSFADQLGDEKQSAVIGSFEEQRKIWSTPQNSNENSS